MWFLGLSSLCSFPSTADMPTSLPKGRILRHVQMCSLHPLACYFVCSLDSMGKKILPEHNGRHKEGLLSPSFLTSSLQDFQPCLCPALLSRDATCLSCICVMQRFTCPEGKQKCRALSWSRVCALDCQMAVDWYKLWCLGSTAEQGALGVLRGEEMGSLCTVVFNFIFPFPKCRESTGEMLLCLLVLVLVSLICLFPVQPPWSL